MTLVNRIRENRGQGNDVEDAIDKAVVSCIEDDVLKEFLLKHRTEVLDVCITEFNKDVYEEGIRAEGREARGFENARAMLADNMDISLIVKYSGLTESQVLSLNESMAEYSVN